MVSASLGFGQNQPVDQINRLELLHVFDTDSSIKAQFYQFEFMIKVHNCFSFCMNGFFDETVWVFFNYK